MAATGVENIGEGISESKLILMYRYRELSARDECCKSFQLLIINICKLKAYRMLLTS